MFSARGSGLGRVSTTRVAAAGASLAAASFASAGAILKYYVGPPNGLWNVANNWSPVGVPNNGGGFTYDALIDDNRDASAVTLSGSFTVHLLGITTGDSLTIANGSALGLNGPTLSNFGTLTLGSINATTDLRSDAASLIIGGPGTTLTTNTQNNRIYSSANTHRITIADDHLLAGSMQFGVNQTRLTNDGVIDASLTSGITVDLTDGPGLNFNTGTMRASNGGTMTINGSVIENSGVIEADVGSSVSLTSSHIIGGILRDLDGPVNGTVRTSTSATLENVTIEGGYVGVNGTGTFLRGGLSVPSPIYLSSINATTDLRADTTPLTISGAGGVICSNTQNNRVYGVANNIRIIVAPESGIAGSLQLGVNQTLLTNEGTIDANQTSGITVDLTDGAGLHFNTGIMRASNGATMTINGTVLDNTGGELEASAASTVSLTSAHIISGTLIDADGPGAGSVRTSSNATLEDVTVEGGYFGVNGTLTILRGGIDLNAPLALGSINATTDLRIDTTPLTLSGPGGVICSNTQNNRVYGVANNLRLIVAPESSISGSLQLGANQTLLTNEGVIDANTSSGMTVDLTDGAGLHFNTGTMRASNGGTMTILGTVLDNTDGLIEADANSAMSLSSAHIIGGTLRDIDGVGAGLVRTASTATLESVSIEGGYIGSNGTLTVLRGTVDLQDPIILSSINATTDLRVDTGPFTLAGPGGVACTNTQNNRLYGLNGLIMLTIAPESSVRGSLQLGANQTGIVNQGSILADASSGITIDPTDGPGFLNEGLLHLSAGNVTIGGGSFNNTGTVQIDAGRVLTRVGVYSQTDGRTQVAGALSSPTGVTLAGGVFSGTGSVTGAFTNSGGTVAPGASAGQLSLATGYTQGAGGELSIEVGGSNPGTQYDRLAVTGNASLNGTLVVSRINGFNPGPRDAFTILTCTGSRTGTFTEVQSCDVVQVTYTSNSVIVQFADLSGIAGDVNNDGWVNGADLAIVLGNWGPCEAACCVGDLTGDGIIDGADLAIVLGNWAPKP